jgi:hypothetical protein
MQPLKKYHIFTKRNPKNKKTMIKLIKYSCLALITLVLTSSCNKDDSGVNDLTNSSLIKLQLSNDKVISKYRYNDIGKIAETEGTYFYNRYIYNSDGKLIKCETAADPSMYSSSLPVEKNDLMTAENSTISNYLVFKYDENKNLSEIENYVKQEVEFKLRSKQSFEFVNGNITRRNLHNETGKVTQFYVYEYDQYGNVKNEKYYSFLSSEPKLIIEDSFKYDDKKNPFRIFKELGYPGLNTNQNNVIEVNTILYEVTSTFDKNSTRTTSYKYDRNNCPIKVMSEKSEHEYRY